MPKKITEQGCNEQDTNKCPSCKGGACKKLIADTGDMTFLNFIDESQQLGAEHPGSETTHSTIVDDGTSGGKIFHHLGKAAQSLTDAKKSINK